MARNEDDATFEVGTAPVPERTAPAPEKPGEPGEPGEPERPEPQTAEYPAIEGVLGRLGDGGRQGPNLADEIGKPLDPRRREEGPVSAPSVRTGGGAMRGLFWLVATIGLVVALVLGARAVGFWPDLKSPFDSKTTDRSQPALLKSIQDLSQFVAAEGNFEVIVDVQQNRKYIPDFLLNRRILFIASGSVEAYVDFGAIGQGAVKESEDRRTVEISLPAPQLRPPRIDSDRSYVYEEQRGGLDRIADLFKSDPNRLQEVYRLAEEKIGTAAKEAGLTKRAEENTRKMLEQFLRALGYTTITVTFPAP
jgi:Protein of unknown function (DUF4230)